MSKEIMDILSPILGDELAAPTYEDVAALLRYDPNNGRLYWLPREICNFKNTQAGKAWNKKYAGQEAFTARSSVYRQGTLLGRHYVAHRVCWLLHHKKWPDHFIDHIDGNGSNNRIANLRDVEASVNQRNSAMKVTNTSGNNGVRLDRFGKKWTARISVDGREIYLGTFNTVAEAVASRRGAEKVLGFTQRHGSPRGKVAV